MKRVIDFFVNVYFIPSMILIILYFYVTKVLRTQKKEVATKTPETSDSDKNKTD